jgi:alkyldihydroxyacetonephosphate synthase
MTEPTMPNAYPSEHFINEGPALDCDIVAEIDARGVAINTIDAVRADHGRDWWPRTIRQVARGHVPAWPGAVCFPRSTSQVADVLTIAHAHGVPVTAQGGRSGVVGGALVAEGGLALDTTRLNQILDIDEISGTVRVEAGVFGPDLETALNARGFTVGHFPQSFDLATVGGWLACRGAGQFSNRYGKIEDIVRGLTVVLANGDVLTLGGHGPRG